MEELQIITEAGIVANRWPNSNHKEFGVKDRIYIKIGKEDQGYFDLKSGAFEQNDGWGIRRGGYVARKGCHQPH